MSSLTLIFILLEIFFGYTVLDNHGQSNFICSPLSALMPLGKLALAAVDESLKELLKAIGINNKDEIKNHFKPMLNELRYLPGVRLSIGSNLYVYKDIKMNKTFRENARDIFQASVDRVDFERAAETAAKINNWVSRQTFGKIKDMVNPNDLDYSTSMIIVNAVYFQGKWNESFESDGRGQFHTQSGKVNVKMMKRIGTYNYTNSSALNAELIYIPYAGGMANFMVVLPNEDDGLRDLLKKLKDDPTLLDAATTKMEPTMLSVKLPPFKITAKLDLGYYYQRLNVKQMFEEKSGLDEMVRSAPIRVSKASHKAYISVNEKGTTAAAASSTHHVKSYMKHFNADRPFLYFIIVKGQQLFAGTFVHPASR